MEEQDSELEKRLRLGLIGTFVFPVMSNGSNGLGLEERWRKKALEMWNARSMLRISWSEKENLTFVLNMWC